MGKPIRNAGQPIRAGGYVLGESGWELERPPRPAAAAMPAGEEVDEPAATAGVAVDVDTGEETPAGQPLPEVAPAAPGPVEADQRAGDADRAVCPDCGKEVAVRKDGSLRKHICVIEAAPPQVTFEEGEGDGGDSAAEGR